MNGAERFAFTIRRATPGDEALAVALLYELALFEKLGHAFTLDAAALARALFGEDRSVACDLAFHGEEPAGLALWFWTYRSFRGERGLFIEDLYVRPAFRGRGLGKALLAHLARQGTRLEWRVLDWNEKALAFYRGLGAKPLQDWLVYQLDGEALERLGG